MKNLILLLLVLISATSLMFGGEISNFNTKLNSPPPTLVNSFYWGEHEVTTEKYPILPLSGTFGSDTALTFINNGTQDIYIDAVSIKVISGNPNSFILNGFKLEVKEILSKYGRLTLKPGQKLVEQVYFSPKSEGLHEIELTFDNDANIPAKCTLSGTGIKSAASIDNDYEKDIVIVNDDKSIQISKTTDEQLSYKLISLTGSQIASGSLETSTEISFSNFTQQMLFLEISDSKNEVVLWKKVLVE